VLFRSWAIEGWAELRRRGRFIQPAGSEAIIDEMTELGSPVAAFVRQRCHVGTGYKVVRSELFDAYLAWTKEQGIVKPLDAARFGRDLRAVLPKLDSGRPREDEGDRVRTYFGVGLKQGF
jgi:putative DNA primase/helicase